MKGIAGNRGMHRASLLVDRACTRLQRNTASEQGEIKTRRSFVNREEPGADVIPKYNTLTDRPHQGQACPLIDERARGRTASIYQWCNTRGNFVQAAKHVNCKARREERERGNSTTGFSSLDQRVCNPGLRNGARLWRAPRREYTLLSTLE